MWEKSKYQWRLLSFDFQFLCLAGFRGRPTIRFGNLLIWYVSVQRGGHTFSFMPFWFYTKYIQFIIFCIRIHVLTWIVFDFFLHIFHFSNFLIFWNSKIPMPISDSYHRLQPSTIAIDIVVECVHQHQCTKHPNKSWMFALKFVLFFEEESNYLPLCRRNTLRRMRLS